MTYQCRNYFIVLYVEQRRTHDVVVVRLPDEQRRANVHRQLLRRTLLHRMSGRGERKQEGEKERERVCVCE